MYSSGLTPIWTPIWPDPDLACVAYGRAPTDDSFDFPSGFTQFHSKVFEHVGRHSSAFSYEPKQNMLGVDVFVVEPLGLLICQLHNFLGTIRELFKHWCDSPAPQVAR